MKLPCQKKTPWPRVERRKYMVVVGSCTVRSRPSADADVVGARQRGSIVNMFEFDESGKWRRVFADGQGAGGWMLLVHDEFGHLLEPVQSEADDPPTVQSLQEVY
mmetsp:Transcript_1804/g.3236  ORF Transcript_1804/g.3236 Transcript_1804/m.3236 type:complete len:105 (+) Transcript_1804:250-564(+)